MSLILVPTPIGNLEDITLRALKVLREADLIACEDTRTSSILLKHYGIDKPLTSFHVHNENEKLPLLLGKLRAGENIAVISDAGTPGISDPGWILLKRAIDEGLEVDVLPGASAVFPPEKSGERIKLFESVKNFPFTLCFYISPHKAEKNILDMLEVFGDRKASLIREISKIFQEAIRGTLSQILERVHEGLKGELVLVIEGGKSEADNDLWKSEALKLKEEGESVKDIVKAISEKYHVPKNEIKKFILEV